MLLSRSLLSMPSWIHVFAAFLGVAKAAYAEVAPSVELALERK
jgi:hypothetical protein